VQHGVGYGTHTGLQGSQAVGQATCLDFGAQEVEQVVSDLLGVFVRLEQWRRDVRLAGQYDTAHLGRIDRNAHGADSGADVVHRNVFTRILTGGARHVDIVHAFVLTRSRRVQLDDHVFGGLYENRRVAYGTGRNDLTVFGDSSGFNDGVVDLRQDALADQFSHVRQVLVDVQHFAGVDLFALYRVALIRNALVDDARLSHGLVGGRAHGSVGEQVDLELLFLATLGQCPREFLRFTKQSETTHTQRHAVFDPRCCFFCRYNLVQESSIANVLF